MFELIFGLCILAILGSLVYLLIGAFLCLIHYKVIRKVYKQTDISDTVSSLPEVIFMLVVMWPLADWRNASLWEEEEEKPIVSASTFQDWALQNGYPTLMGTSSVEIPMGNNWINACLISGNAKRAGFKTAVRYNPVLEEWVVKEI